MSPLARRRLMIWLLVLASLLPAALFAYLGGFSRLMGDDWCYFASAKWLGFRDHFAHFYTTLHGSYSYITLHELLSRLGPEIIPPLFPAFLIGLWLLGAVWLLRLLAGHLPLRGDRMMGALAVGGLCIGASIYALPDWEAIYWYSGSSRHILPWSMLLIYCAWSWQLATRPRARGVVAVCAFFGALFCFVGAGFYELGALLQAIYFSLLLAWLWFATEGATRTRALTMTGAGLLGSTSSLLLQLSSPGARHRVEQFASLDYANPIHDLPELFVATMRTSLEFFGHAAGVAGFTLMLAVGAVAALLLLAPGSSAKRRSEGSLRQAAGLALAIVALLGLTQLEALDYRAVAGLFAGALALLGILCWRLRCPGDLLARRLGMTALLFLSLSLITKFVPVAAGHYTLGTIYPRSITNSVALTAIAGLSCGVYLGCLLQRAIAAARGSDAWQRRFVVGGCLTALVCLGGIVALQLRLAPDFATYAREFDSRHQRIENLRDSGERVIEVQPYSFDMSRYIASRDMHLICRGSQHYFYGVERIIHLKPGEASRGE